MAEEKREKFLRNCLVAAKSSLNASALSSEGNSVPLKNCAIDTMQISTLGEYLARKKVRENPEIGMNDEIQALIEDSKLARSFVVPVMLPNGQEIEVVVNKKGQDMACMYRDESGEHEFTLTPRMKKEIERGLENSIPENLEEIVGGELIGEIKSEYLPQNLDELAENISNDEVVPEGKEDILKKVNKKTGSIENKLEEEKKAEEAKKEIPPETRDVVAKICSENGLDISALKEVMEVPPQVISENLENTGFRENNGRITCLRFRDGEKLQGRVVMVQGGKVVDNRMYDDYMNDYMNEHRGEKRVKSVEDEHDKLTYTDLDGNTTVCEIMREPRDLVCSDKERLQEEMAELDLKTEQILNSDMPLADKSKAIASVNNERLAAFSEYGITCPTVESEIIADIEIAEKVEAENAPELDSQTDIEAFEVPGKRTRE